MDFFYRKNEEKELHSYLLTGFCIYQAGSSSSIAVVWLGIGYQPTHTHTQ